MSFLDVLLRGASLSGQALALGGVAFIVVVLRARPSRVDGVGARDEIAPLRRAFDLTALGAGLLALFQTLALALEMSVLAGGEPWPVHAALGTLYFRAGLARILGCVALAAVAAIAARRGRPPQAWTLGAGAAVVAASAAAMTHAVAQLEGRARLVGITAVHQLAAALWVGGLVHLVVTMFNGERPTSAGTLVRFSNLALGCVIALASTGVALGVAYVGSPAALVGTAYGVMVLTKVIILGALVVFGALNHRAVRRLGNAQRHARPALRQFLEVEVGLGLTVLFVAASLTSAPPARDVVADRASPAELAAMFTPQWPRLATPSHAELASAASLGDPSQPRTAEDRAWSEYNHHVAGAFVLLIGLLALASARPWGNWARHWPLLLLGLAAFLFVRNDPEAWPLGPIGFWESMRDPEVVQHRVFVLLIVLFGLFEWMVRTDRLRDLRWAAVFPLLCVVGGALLLTHSHAVSSVKSQFLMEITHTPLSLLGLVVGWGRWLELRLPDHGDGVPARVWSLALVVVGVLLLLYRER